MQQKLSRSYAPDAGSRARSQWLTWYGGATSRLCRVAGRWLVAHRPRPVRVNTTPREGRPTPRGISRRKQGGRPYRREGGDLWSRQSRPVRVNTTPRQGRRTPRGIGCRKQGGQPLVPRRRAGKRPSSTSLDEPHVASTCAIQESAAGPNPGDRETEVPHHFGVTANRQGTAELGLECAGAP